MLYLSIMLGIFLVILALRGSKKHDKPTFKEVNSTLLAIHWARKNGNKDV